MDTELKKKLVIPFIVFIGLLAVNINSIVNGVNNHNTWRVVAATASCILIGIAFFVVIRSIRKSGRTPEA